MLCDNNKSLQFKKKSDNKLQILNNSINKVYSIHKCEYN